MISVNSYFEGKVQSLGFTNEGGKFTAGVMVAGDYEFGTSTQEWMTLTSGAWEILLPGASVYRNFAVGETFTVEAGKKFRLKVSQDSAYLCRYA